MKNLRILAVLILLGASAVAGTISITDSDFSAITITCGSFAYQGSGSCPAQDLNSNPGWTFSNLIPGVSGAGVISSADGAFPPPSFAGLGTTQAALLQLTGSVSQQLYGFTQGQGYDLTFYLGSRPSAGNQSVQVQIGNETMLFNLNNNTPFTLERVHFTADGTSELLTFLGTDPRGGDNTAFLTDVSITATPEPVTLVLFGSGLVGIGGMMRRRFIG